MTPKESAVIVDRLLSLIASLQQRVEDNCCTCTPEDGGKFHAPSRRRRDSRCLGVQYALEGRRFVEQGERLSRQLHRQAWKDQ